MGKGRGRMDNTYKKQDQNQFDTLSKKYKWFLFIAILFPQIHFIPRLFIRTEHGSVDFATVMVWAGTMAITHLISSVGLFTLLLKHKRMFRKGTMLCSGLFLCISMLMMLAFLALFRGEGLGLMLTLLFGGPIVAAFIMLLYSVMYYLLIFFLLKDFVWHMKTREWRIIEKIGIYLPLVFFGCFFLLVLFFFEEVVNSLYINFYSTLLQQQELHSTLYWGGVFSHILYINLIPIILIGKDWIDFS